MSVTEVDWITGTENPVYMMSPTEESIYVGKRKPGLTN